MALSPDDLARYDRQIRISEIGVEGQSKLKRAKVLVVGLGGLGCAAATYLAAAGVGLLTLFDYELVEPSNLNRQVLHGQDDIGASKPDSAAKKLRQLNPLIEIRALRLKGNYEAFRRLVPEQSVVLDCLDDWEVRFQLNRACVESNIPLVHAGVSGFGGQLLVVIPRKGPCLQCVFPTPPERRARPVIGAAAGILGCMQALEAIKVILGIPPVQGLLLYDGMLEELDRVSIARKSDCPACA